MPTKNISLSHLTEFMSSTPLQRRGLVRKQIRQAAAPTGERIPSFYYAPVIKAAIEFVNDGYLDDPFELFVAGLPDQRANALHRKWNGVKELLEAAHPVSAKRAASRLCPYVEGAPGVKVEPHLALQFDDGVVERWFFWFGEEKLGAGRVNSILHLLDATADRSLFGVERSVVAIPRSRELIRDFWGRSTFDEEAHRVVVAVEEYGLMQAELAQEQ